MRKFKGSVQAVIATNKIKGLMTLTKSASTGHESNESNEPQKSPAKVKPKETVKESLKQEPVSKPIATKDDSVIGKKTKKKKKKGGCAQQ